MDCHDRRPLTCPPKEKYNYVRTVNDVVVTVPSCPSKYFPFILQTHQLMMGKYMEQYNTDSILAWHGLGSGKTITSIMTALQTNSTVYVFCPAALIENYVKELRDYAAVLRKFQAYTHPSNAIEVANTFIQKALQFKPELLEEDTIPLVTKILDYVGIGKAPKQEVLHKIAAAGDYASLIKIMDTYTGGKTRKRGGAKEPMTVETLTFYFISSNGDLYNPTNPEGHFQHFINEAIPNKLGVIDESQLTISSALDKLKFNSIAGVGKELKAKIAASVLPSIITQDVFEEFDCCARFYSSGYAKTTQDHIYEGFCSATDERNPNRGRLLLLSGTPIVKHPAEIALVVNMLSGNPRLMCYNKYVFNYNFGTALPVPEYLYTLDNAERKAQLTEIQQLPLKNHAHFIELCQPYISYFGNVDSMMPTIHELVGHKYVYDNNGKVCANIVECRMGPEQLGWLKYLEFIESVHKTSVSVTSYLKKRFFDYTFPLNTPLQSRPKNVPRAMVEKGFFTDRPVTQREFLIEYARDFQKDLLEVTHTKAAAVARAAFMKSVKHNLSKGGKTKKRKRIGGAGKPNYDINAKLSALRQRIQSNINDRHVIYSNSRISNVMISRMLDELGFSEIKNVVGLGDETPRFAFLTGEQIDKEDADTMFEFAENEGLAEDKQLLIRAYNNPDIKNLRILIIGNAVAEGITLKRTNFMHIYSFPYNISKMLQLLARANRNCVFPDGGIITPYLYLSSIEQNAVMDTSVRMFCRTIHTSDAEWVEYNRVHDIRQIKDERNLFEEAVRENDSFIPHLFAIKNASFDN